MALTLIGKNQTPCFTALSTDIVESKIVGAAIPGMTVFILDTQAWYIIQPDLTLGTYALPITLAGDVDVGSVSLDQSVPGTSNGVVAAKSVAGADTVANNVSKLIAPGTTTEAPLSVVPLVYNGSTFDRLRGDKTDGLLVQGVVTVTSGDITAVVSGTADVTGSSVAIDQTTSGTTNKVTVGVSAAVSDGIGNYGSVLNAPGTVNSSPVLAEGLYFNGTTWDRIRGDATNGLKTYGTSTISGTASTVLGNVGFLDNTGAARGYVYYDSSPQIVALPYSYAISHANVPNHTAFQKIGYQPASATGSRAVWNVAGEYVFPLANQQMEVVSTDNTNDKAGGNGALTVKIYYLTSAFVEKTTTVILNGTAAVLTTPSDLYRINAFRVATAGATGVAAGTISIRNSTDHTTVYDQIALGMTDSRTMVYTVPTGKNLYIANVYFSAASGDTFSRVNFTARATYDFLAGALTTDVFLPYSEYIMQNDVVNVDLQVPLKFPAGTDYKMSVIGQAGAICSCGIRGWLDAG